MTTSRHDLALDLMTRFAARTFGDRDTRYLWTDAFAVGNFLALGRADTARELVDRVHRTLGRHRPDDPRRGWLSGLSDTDGAAHPTRGGLRIGKPLPERRADEPLDDRLEWDRDGQYFHYLTKWMVALDRLARADREPRYSTWARELADVAHRAFVVCAGTARRMWWKASIDLSRPAVASMGQHDALDGFVTYRELAATAAMLDAPGPDLSAAIADFAAMIDPRGLATSDPLGLGGLFADAARLADQPAAHELAGMIVAAATAGLHDYLARTDLLASPERRLAFRELGLAIGIAAAGKLRGVARFAAVGRGIETFWADAANRKSRGWLDHADINDVMLATCLLA